MELLMEVDNYLNPGSLPWLSATSVDSSWILTNPVSPTC